MAGSVNKVILIGNLGKDPQVRSAQFRRPGRQLHARHLGELARQGHRRAQGKDRVAQHRGVQREHRQGRRAILQEGHQGLRRGPVADPQMDRPVGRREIHHRDRAAALPRRADAARFARRAAGKGAKVSAAAKSARPSFGRTSPVERRPALVTGAGGAAAARIWTTIFRSERH